MTTPRRVGIFAVGGRRWGLGHLYRMRLLAAALAREWRAAVVLVIPRTAAAAAFAAAVPDPVRTVLVPARYAIAAALPPVLARPSAPFDLLIFDCPPSPPARIRAARGAAAAVATIDDFGPAAGAADLAVNLLYRPTVRPRRGRALFSPRLMPLRSEFGRGPRERVRPRVRRLLVLAGGADGHGVSLAALAAARELHPRPRVTVVTGPAYRHHHALRRLAASWPALRIRPNVSRPDRLMRRADLAISAGGVTLFELCALGVPTLGLTGEPKEEETLRRMHRAGAVDYAGPLRALTAERIHRRLARLAADVDRRRRLSVRARRLVDGRGLARLVRELARSWREARRRAA